MNSSAKRVRKVAEYSHPRSGRKKVLKSKKKGVEPKYCQYSASLSGLSRTFAHVWQKSGDGS
jgi:hypothetical protein